MTRRLRGSRAIEYSSGHSIDFMWLVSGRTIDHTTISEFRRKHQAQLKDIHRQMIRTTVDMGLARLSEQCIDGTRVLADANRYKTWTPPPSKNCSPNWTGRSTRRWMTGRRRTGCRRNWRTCNGDRRR